MYYNIGRGEDMSRRHPSCFMAGVNGVGKTLLAHAISAHEALDIQILKGSELFMSYLGIKPRHYEELRALPHDEAMKALSQMMRGILDTYVEQAFIFDSHFRNLVRGKTKDVVGPWIQEFDILVLVTAPPEVVFKRIMADERDRALFSEGLTPEQQYEMYQEYTHDYENRFAEIAKRRTHDSVIYVHNDTTVESAADEFLAGYNRFMQGAR